MSLIGHRSQVVNLKSNSVAFMENFITQICTKRVTLIYIKKILVNV